MLGVVLWRCEDSKSAMIWCEDHGDLAFLNVEADLVGVSVALEPGDLLRFEIRNGGEMREAYKASWVTREFAPDLVQMLEGIETPEALTLAPAPTRAPLRTAHVVPFPQGQEARRKQRKRAAAY